MFLLVSGTLLTPWAAVLMPYCFVRAVAPARDLAHTLLLSAITSLGLNALVPLLMHLAGIPITAVSLLPIHGTLTILSCAAMFVRRAPLMPVITSAQRPLLLILCAFALLVIPVTPLAGIDTYKWQDLATSLHVENSIAWYVHPASLFGFSPRAYPSLQPLLLGTFQAMGSIGVAGGFYLVSLVSGLLGISGAFCLGADVFKRPAGGHILALLYAFSPVFMRYNHWATGRGFFVSLLPVLILGLLHIRSCRGLILTLTTTTLLLLSHKTAWIGLPLILLTMPASLLIPRKLARPVGLGLMTIAILISIAVAQPFAAGGVPGMLMGFVKSHITRLSIYGVLATIALWHGLAPGSPYASRLRRFILPLAITFPLAHIPDMYGALITLPCIAIFATAGVLCLRAHMTRAGHIISRAAILLAILAGLAVLTNRSITATPRRIRAAARFLEMHDPNGPYIIRTAGIERTQIQAYVSGCPRYALHLTHPPTLVLRRPPAIGRSPRKTIAAWTTYLRHCARVSGVSIAWYGDNPRAYRVTIDKPLTPDPRNLLYHEDGVAIYGPREIPAPDGG